MALSPNYGWSEPDNSSLVKNGAADIRTLGDAIDTSVWNVGFGQAGKNKIINGNFSINQRSFSSVTTSGTFTFDRWYTDANGGTFTYTPQTFTPGAAPVSGYESTNFLRCVTSGQSGSHYAAIIQRIEDVRTLAGQTATVSFWAKAASGTPSILVQATQRFGSGGSSAVATNLTAQVLSTSWARYSITFAVPSVSGKTIGTGSNLEFNFFYSFGGSVIGIQNNTFDLWGVQVEYGSKATPFQTASGGSPQQELAMCQRYYFRNVADLTYGRFAFGSASSTTAASLLLTPPVTMRTTPTSLDTGGTIALSDFVTTTNTTALTLSGQANKSCILLDATVASGLTQYRPYNLLANSSATAYIGVSAEL